jgi:hypothetical protein
MASAPLFVRCAFENPGELANFQRNGGAADKANGIIDTRAKDCEHGT